ncbi:MAG: TldD/PmbA family protein [Theionarchaea archaeon]|nr:TldD/PmbA family protein [Theionarchaea archaeon]
MQEIVLNSDVDLAIMRKKERRIIMIIFKDNRPETVTSTFGNGYCARVLVDGSWGFASTTREDQLRDILKKARTLALHSRNYKHSKIELAPLAPSKGTWKSQRIVESSESAITELCELIGACQQRVLDQPSIVSSTINLNLITDSSMLCTSEGSFITQKEQRILGTISTVGREKGDMASYYTEFGGQYGSDMLSESSIEEKCMQCFRICQTLLHSPLPPSGKTEVVLDPTLVGFLVHEAVGHAAEADIALGGSCLLGKTGQRIAAESVTITDNPCYLGAPGSYGYDDEGVPARPTALLDRGVVSGFLHNRETSFYMGAEPHGNARAWNFSCEPVIRMSNTYLHPQDLTLEELIEDVHDGYLVSAGHMGGESDYNGEFTIGTGFCQKIEHGVLTEKKFKGPVITGNAFEVLHDITSIGNREVFEIRAATCGKTQPAFVGVGGPPVKTHVMFRGGG